MIWQVTAPKGGDIIRVCCGEVYHYGIYVSDSEIIQFGQPPTTLNNVSNSDITVCTTDIKGFADEETIEVGIPEAHEKALLRDAESVIKYAREKIGSGGYNLIHNNCEHFANDCLFGEKKSMQIEFIRNMFKSIPVVDVYYTGIPKSDEYKALYPREREEYVNKTNNTRVKKERYYVWKLLEYALDRSFGMKISELEFTRDDLGKWKTDKCFFSLSHSGNIVAVAVSTKPVGVDVEKIDGKRDRLFANKILTDDELRVFDTLDESEKSEYLICRWTEKESIFKLSGSTVFSPSKISSYGNVNTRNISLSNEIYSLSVASDHIDRLRIYESLTEQIV